jgi:hypothetical protein
MKCLRNRAGKSFFIDRIRDIWSIPPLLIKQASCLSCKLYKVAGVGTSCLNEYRISKPEIKQL